MIIYIQWAKADPEDWFAVDLKRIQHVRQLAQKSEPTGIVTIDNEAGWISSINCQGLIFEGYDKYNIDVVGDGLRITGIQDDPEDYPEGYRHAIEYTIMPCGPDPRIGGIINTNQSIRVWVTPDDWERWAACTNVELHPWTEFTYPTSGVTFYGVWVNNYTEHQNIRSFHGWKEWA